MKKQMKRIVTWKGYHRYGGLVLSVFLLLFCVSGIILNHRSLFSDWQISRAWLPRSYHFIDYNNGILKGTVALGGDSLLAYGCAGIWLTDKDFAHFRDFNTGLPHGIDGRNIKNVVKTADGVLWCAAQYGLYRKDGDRWVEQDLPGNEERLSDVALDKAGRQVVAMTRSYLYILSPQHQHGQTLYEVARRALPPPADHMPKVMLFKTVWQLHSGELFGMTGRVVVDLLAVVLAVLSLTGILLFFTPYAMRRHKRLLQGKVRKWEGNVLKWSQRWHNRLGYYLLALTLIVVLTGMCLRPPLMIPLVLTKTAPLPGTIQDRANVWTDKLRALRWDVAENAWLIFTSEGFVRADAHFSRPPVWVPSHQSPPVSPMGINVFKPDGPGRWLIGSFIGMYRWAPARGEVVDYFSGKAVVKKMGRPVAPHMISGYTELYGDGTLLTFDYIKGCKSLPPMPELLKQQPMSLWNFALELHVGRCYTPFLGPLSELFVFLSGLLIALVLVSGYIILHRRRMKRRKKISIHNNHLKLKNNEKV